MVRIKEYYHLHEAYIDRAILNEEGVVCFVQNENTNTIKPDGYTPSVFLSVHEEDVDKALEILVAPHN